MNKQILRLAIPFIISNITVPIVSSVDTALMGNYASLTHLGAIGLGSAIFNFLYWNFAFIRMSTVGMTAQESGRKNHDEIATLLGRSLFIATIGAFILLIFQIPICKLIFLITKGDINTEIYAKEYFFVRIWAAPATIGLMALTGWFIGLQNAKTPMFIALLVNVVNISLSILFVTIFNMNSKGVALGTVIGQYCGLALGVIVLLKKYREYTIKLNLNRILELRKYKKFFSVNIDIFIRTLAVILVLTSYNLVSAKKGETILGINVIFLQLVFAFSFFTDGFANAAESLIGNYFGAGNKEKLKTVVRFLFYWGVAIALIFTFLYIFAWESIISIFTKNPDILAVSKKYNIWIIVFPLVSILTFIWDGVFLGATATSEMRNATILAALLFFTIYLIFDSRIGNHALLIAQLVFFGMRGILQTFYYKPAILERNLNLKLYDSIL